MVAGRRDLAPAEDHDHVGHPTAENRCDATSVIAPDSRAAVRAARYRSHNASVIRVEAGPERHASRSRSPGDVTAAGVFPLRS
jgi:hypothetical protein